jgi:hypothetical protein
MSATRCRSTPAPRGVSALFLTLSLPLATALGCRNDTPVAPDLTVDLGQSSQVTTQATNTIIVTNLLNNLSVNIPVTNAKEATKICAAVAQIDVISSDLFSCTIP